MARPLLARRIVTPIESTLGPRERKTLPETPTSLRSNPAPQPAPTTDTNPALILLCVALFSFGLGVAHLW